MPLVTELGVDGVWTMPDLARQALIAFGPVQINVRPNPPRHYAFRPNVEVPPMGTEEEDVD